MHSWSWSHLGPEDMRRSRQKLVTETDLATRGCRRRHIQFSAGKLSNHASHPDHRSGLAGALSLCNFLTLLPLATPRRLSSPIARLTRKAAQGWPIPSYRTSRSCARLIAERSRDDNQRFGSQPGCRITLARLTMVLQSKGGFHFSFFIITG